MMMSFFLGAFCGFWFTVGAATAVVVDEGEDISWSVVGQWAWLVCMGPITMVRAFLDACEGE